MIRDRREVVEGQLAIAVADRHRFEDDPVGEVAVVLLQPREDVRDRLDHDAAPLPSQNRSAQRVVLLAVWPQLSEISFAAENRTRDPLGEDGPRKLYTDPFPAQGLITLTLEQDA